jgi:hypothetical protein
MVLKEQLARDLDQHRQRTRDRTLPVVLPRKVAAGETSVSWLAGFEHLTFKPGAMET